MTEFIRLQADTQTHQQLTHQLRTQTGRMEAEIVRRGQELQDANRQLRALHDELEARVDARTAELRESYLQLEDEIEDRRQAETALRKSEEQLRQAQKLEAVGRLAGGIAHDFNNLLSVVLSYSELALGEIEGDSPAALPLREIQRAGHRAADLTRQLLAFSRQQVLDLSVIDLNDVLGGAGRLLARVLGEDIELKILPASAPATVRADKGQVDQVILNLVVNARDAMPQGGKLTVACSLVDLDEDYAREHVGVTPASYVMLSVSDTGVGMSKATQARAFEPFFTTKEQGKGTGLGLSTVFGIVKQSGGHIWLYSEPGTGTTFKIYLPRVAEAVDPLGDSSLLPDQDQFDDVSVQQPLCGGKMIRGFRGFQGFPGAGTRSTPAAERPVGGTRRGGKMKATRSPGSHLPASSRPTAAASPRVGRVPLFLGRRLSPALTTDPLSASGLRQAFGVRGSNSECFHPLNSDLSAVAASQRRRSIRGSFQRQARSA